MNAPSETITGVALLNMGGPSRLEEVQPFLRALFSDRELVPFPGGPRLQPLWAWAISTLRAAKVRGYYADLGGSSPLVRLTTRQAELLAASLNRRGQGHFFVEPVMRYTAPRAAEAVRKLLDAGAQRLIALPLYPHFSRATSGSSLADLRRAASHAAAQVPILSIDDFHAHPAYLASVAAAIAKARLGLSLETPVLFSAHGLPQKMIDQGDPYLTQVQRTVEEVSQRLGLANARLCFQSRSGPARWLEPDVHRVIDELAAAGQRQVLIVPISFVSDHIETLHELDLRLAGYCRQRGIEYHRTPSLNDDPLFIEALTQLVLERTNA